MAAAFAVPWLSLFGTHPAMLAAGTQYLRSDGPPYGFFSVGLVLYFASQGAGRLLWPVIGNLARMVVAAVGGWLAICWGGGLPQVFLSQGVALVVYGVLIASAIAGRAAPANSCAASSLTRIDPLPPAGYPPPVNRQSSWSTHYPRKA